MSTLPPSNFVNLKKDERGAAIVLGIVLALAVVGGMWCLIGVGEALIARDLAQEATDSAAFTSAVMHARGMNVISFINMVLLAMVVVYLTLSWFDLIVSAVWFLVGVNMGINWCVFRYPIDAVTGVPVPWCNIATSLKRVSASLLKFDRVIFDRFEHIAPYMFETQVWVAQAVPWLGTLSGAQTSLEYGHGTLTLGLSHFPGGGAIRPLDTLFSLGNAPFLNKRGKDPGDPEINWLQDRRVGLPVESEGAYQLCIRGARFPLMWLKDVVTQLSGAKFLDAEPAGIVSFGLFQSAGEFNRLLFCNEKDEKYPLELDNDDELHGLMRRDAGKKRLKMLAKLLGATSNTGLHKLFYWGLMEFPSNKANDKFYLESHYVWRMAWPDPWKQRKDDGFVSGPKKVPPYAFNGNDWMQIWAWTFVNPAENPLADRIVSLPSKVLGQEQKVARNDERRTFTAQAEFYYDCPAVWASSRCNQVSLATYQLKWKARLRREHSWDLSMNIALVVIDNFLLGPVFVGKIKDWTTKVVGAPVVREGAVKALRNYAIRYITWGGDKVFGEDRSSDEKLH